MEQGVLGRTNRLLSFHYLLSIRYGTDHIENTASNSSSVACVFFFARGNLFTALLANNGYIFWLLIAAFYGEHTGTQH
jgi:hypothetical protein